MSEHLPAHVRGSATSEAAARHMLPRLGTTRRRIYDAIKAAPDGLTAEELCLALSISGDTIRPRLRELEGVGDRPTLIEKRGERELRSGNKGMIYRLAEARPASGFLFDMGNDYD